MFGHPPELPLRPPVRGPQAILTFTASAILGIFLAQLSRGRIGHRGVAGTALSAFSLTFVGEVIASMLCYASMTRIGM